MELEPAVADAPLRFVHVDGRRVAYRRAGSGPAALILHGSPQSSLAVADMGRAAAAAGLCAIMPDTPGGGHSAPLPDTPDMEALARALGGFADALGLGRFALYGTHTGGSIACMFAALEPGRVTGLALDGVSDWTEDERDSFARLFAPPFRPSWDGAHMAWLWGRMEAQSVFFPWHAREPAAWRGLDLSSPEHMHRNAMDMLRAGDAYRGLYAAALAFAPGPALSRTEAPARVMTLASDVLLAHAGRPGLRRLPLSVYEAPSELHAAIAAQLAGWGGDPAPACPPSGADRDDITMDMTAEPAGGLCWRGRLEGGGRPLVLLHEAGASSRRFAALLPRIAARRPVIAFDLPGHGCSGPEGLDSGAHAVARRVSDACVALGLDRPAVAGIRFGGVVAAAMEAAGRSADLGPRVDDRAGLASHGAASLAPAWDGAHLLRAWRAATRMAIWDPWFDTSAARVRRPAGELDPEAVQAVAVDLLTAGASWQAAVAIEAASDAAPAETLGGDWSHALSDWARDAL